MHPGFIAWWQRTQRGGCGPFDQEGLGAEVGGDLHDRIHDWRSRHHGRGEGHGHGRHAHGHGFDASGFDGDAGFGVRRPLRFLAFKLELEDVQVAEIATILNDLKTERAQAAVDLRRTTTAFADAIATSELDTVKLAEAATERVKSTERLQQAVGKALGRIHGILSDEQRKRFAYLLRTGTLAI